MSNLMPTVERITPEIAKEYLSHNTNNYRGLSKSIVRNYANDMRNGTFVVNGEAIQFSESGVLLNGQHRLHAIVESGIPLECVVVRGVSDSVNEYDWGRNRSIGQWATANGTPMHSCVIGAARCIVFGFDSNNASRGMIIEFLDGHKNELLEAYGIASCGSHALGRKTSVILAIYTCRELGLVNDDVLMNFFYIFNTGTIPADQIREPSPALIASRMFLTKFQASVGGHGTKNRQYSILMAALNDFKQNKSRHKEYSMSGCHADVYLAALQAKVLQKEEKANG